MKNFVDWFLKAEDPQKQEGVWVDASTGTPYPRREELHKFFIKPYAEKLKMTVPRTVKMFGGGVLHMMGDVEAFKDYNKACDLRFKTLCKVTPEQAEILCVSWRFCHVSFWLKNEDVMPELGERAERYIALMKKIQELDIHGYKIIAASPRMSTPLDLSMDERASLGAIESELKKIRTEIYHLFK
jgi:hypothetical protein